MSETKKCEPNLLIECDAPAIYEVTSEYHMTFYLCEIHKIMHEHTYPLMNCKYTLLEESPSDC